MAYVQSASSGNSKNSDVTSFSVAFSAANKNGNCILVDLVWQQKTPGTGTTSVTDSAGNSYTQIFSTQNLTNGLFIECWAAFSIAAGANTVTVTSSSNAIADVAMAVHEYAGVLAASAVDTSTSVWQTISSSLPEITTGYSAETLHCFGVSRYNGSGALVGVPIGIRYYLQAPSLAWNAREALIVFESIYTFDVQSSIPFPAVINAALGTVAPIGQAFTNEGYGLVALKMTTGILGSEVNNAFAPLKPWLVINEPQIGFTCRSTPNGGPGAAYLFLGDGAQHTWTRTLRQRGTAQIALLIENGDSWMPQPGWPVYLYDQNKSGAFLVFAGTIDRNPTEWFGTNGARIVTISVVSFEQCLDALLVPPQAFFIQATQAIVISLFNSLCGGVPFTLGTISATFVVNAVTYDYDNLWTALQDLATAAQCICGIDLDTLTLYMQPPSTTASPFTLQTSQIAFESGKYEQNRQDYRNRQLIRISQDAFGLSQELFAYAGLPATYTLMRPVQTLVAAYITRNTQNSAIGSFSGQPSPGDTVSISYPQTGSIYNWAPNAPYDVGQVIIDPSNHMQVVTTKGTSGGTQPSWNDSGGTTTDGPGSNIQPGFNGAVIWQDYGEVGPGGLAVFVYTFVASLATYSGPTGVWPVSETNPSGQYPVNALFGFVLIGQTVGATALNLQDAINNNQAVAGQTFSFPTWENPLVNASGVDSSSATPQLTIQNTSPGAGYIAALAASSTGPVFSWSGSQTSGGTTSGGTVQLQVAAQGSSNTANVYYTPGSPTVSIASLPNGASGSALTFLYQRTGGDVIIVEDTAQVNYRAAVENGTGKYQKLLSDTSVTSNTLGYQYVQAALAAYGTIPTQFSFICWGPGLEPGQLLDISFADNPAGLAAIFPNGNYLIQEVTAELVPAQPWMDSPACPGGGHYRYTVTVINVNQIFSYLEFWQQIGSGGGGGGSAIVGSGGTPSGGGSAPSGIYAMGTTGNLVPLPGSAWFQTTGAAGGAAPGVMTGNVTLKPPAAPVAGTSFVVMILVGASPFMLTFDSFYKGVSTIILDQSSTGLMLSIMVLVESASSAQAIISANGVPTT